MAKQKEKRRQETPTSKATPAGGATTTLANWNWYWVLAGMAAVILGFIVYSPALNGPFVLDDIYQYFGRPDAARIGFASWITGGRTLLNATFWLNYQVSGIATGPYHEANVVLHALTSLVVLVMTRRLWQLAGGVGEWAPAVAAALFLLHPIQVESVAYVSSRSDVLSVLFAYSALALQLTSKETALSLWRILAMLVCLGMAVLTKEHTAAMPAVFLLADYFWRGGWQGIRANWRLHGAMVLAGAAGLAFVARTLSGAKSAGFSIKDLTPAAYLFTQFRMFWRYLRLLVLPVGLNVDPDIPVSHSLVDHGAVFGLVAILAVLAGAWMLRHRAPLAAFGIAIFVVLLAPTSSFIPIVDVFAERRAYLPLLGICCLALEAFRRWKIPMAAPAAILALLAYGTWQRSAVWASEEALWTDTVAGSPAKYRPRFQLAYARYAAGRCAEASRDFEVASRLAKPDEVLFVDWALALDCEGKPSDALGKLQQAGQLQNSAHVWSLIGMMQAKLNNLESALASLDEAQARDASFAMTYVYRGNVYLLQGRRADAQAQFQRALQLEPGNTAAIQAMASLGRP